MATACTLVLAACASGPRDNITLVPADKIEQESRKDGLFTQPLKYKLSKPGCKGECPQIEVDSLVFPGVAILTQLVDHALATMTGVSADHPQPYATIKEYQDYFWQTAAARDSTIFTADARYRSRNLTVIELNTWQYYTGAAHGIAATQFLNWDNSAGKVLGTADILQPGAHDRYVQALRDAHGRWLAEHPDAQQDPANFNRLWPFQPSENFALTDAGLVVKYNSYELAPYSSGQPELTIPYEQLQGILKPAYLPG
ncbi:MAG TPA: RsiV family protein [Pusillimonas sp.]|uniref:RsiV family protein n=1 Tax=Pusillimonas sp. TaxID=3040095 RepID=UPI002C12BF7A|nr:RsiV family protein [Pusillimonas sp.]HUH87410.1 RsiV family protein [Pusillimonas sp.]